MNCTEDKTFNCHSISTWIIFSLSRVTIAFLQTTGKFQLNFINRCFRQSTISSSHLSTKNSIREHPHKPEVTACARTNLTEQGNKIWENWFSVALLFVHHLHLAQSQPLAARLECMSFCVNEIFENFSICFDVNHLECF